MTVTGHCSRSTRQDETQSEAAEGEYLYVYNQKMCSTLSIDETLPPQEVTLNSQETSHFIKMDCILCNGVSK